MRHLQRKFVNTRIHSDCDKRVSKLSRHTHQFCVIPVVWYMHPRNVGKPLFLNTRGSSLCKLSPSVSLHTRTRFSSSKNPPQITLPAPLSTEPSIQHYNVMLSCGLYFTYCVTTPSPVHHTSHQCNHNSTTHRDI